MPIGGNPDAFPAGASVWSNHLAGPHVHLDALREDDAAEVATWHQDGWHLRRLDAAPALPRTPDTLNKGWRQLETDGGFPFAVRRRDDGRLVGIVMLDEVLWAQRNAWIAMEIAPPLQGHGYGREALALLIAFAFNEVNLHRLNLTVFSYNQRAVRLYEQAGFQREGVFPEFLRRDGQSYDMLLYGLLEREWRDSHD